MPEPSIEQALGWCRQQLSDSDSPAVDSQVLLGHVLGKSRAYLMTWPERPLSGGQWLQFKQLVSERVAGRPVAHLIGLQEFWSLPLQVNDSTLIPRPDTEALVEAALSLQLPGAARVLDLGTGTGAIALALKSERPAWQVTAVDKEAAAVALARSNAQRLNLSVEVLQSDWFEAIDPTEKFDLIITNPPYIAADDSHLQQGDVRYEPLSALVAASHGMADIDHIICTATDYLLPDGWLLLEQGWQQANSVVERLQQKGYKNINRWTDYASVERVTGAQRAC
ncbi:peptide chain release factor N(5)-glutamine methyltransferase [Idiomarina seosinensis]|uniref:peptide chain release factor N(5)-glutamine methyltransferase n=1 Tax=Idiomarina seosinensis TaxID=281739 RepID=UPI00384B4C48